ncbi:putative acylglycerone-phosphate reductase [Helianthus anomalus]
METFHKQVVLVTGCSSGGIGNALSRAFAAKNCLVVATARSVSSMADLSDNPDLYFLQELDVLSDQSVREVVSNVIHKFGRIDVIVNNAGVQCIGPLAEVPFSSIENTFNTNVYVKPLGVRVATSLHSNPEVAGSSLARSQCPYGSGFPPRLRLAGWWSARWDHLGGSMRLIQAVVPHMVSRKKGKIVNIGSVTALAPGPWSGVYAASKAALHALTDTLRVELKPFGIDVINIVPGSVKTNLGNTAVASYNKMPEWKMYKKYEGAIKERAYFSQGSKAISPDEFANKTVAAILKEDPPSWFSLGQFSTIAAIMYHMPIFVKDFLYKMAMMKC